MAEEFDVAPVLLRNDGEFVMVHGIAMMAQAMVWGFYACVICFSTYSFGRNGFRKLSGARLWMFIVTIFMFTMSTILFIFEIVIFLRPIIGIHMQFTALADLPERAAVVQRPLTVIQFSEDVIFGVEFLMGDAVVIWRTWALWQDTRLAMIFPLTLWFGSLVTLIVERVIYCTTGGLSDTGLVSALSDRLWKANWILSIATNAVATSMIAYKAWQHRQLIKASFGSSARRTKVERILALLVESGFIYLCFWAVQTSVFAVDWNVYSSLQVFVQTVAAMGNQVVGLYPTTIIVLVDLQRTIWDSSPKLSADSNIFVGPSNGTMSSVNFAPGPAPTSTTGATSIIPRTMQEKPAKI